MRMRTADGDVRLPEAYYCNWALQRLLTRCNRSEFRLPWRRPVWSACVSG